MATGIALSVALSSGASKPDFHAPVPRATPAPTASLTPTSTPTSPPQLLTPDPQATLISTLASFGVSVPEAGRLSVTQLMLTEIAVRALAARAVEILQSGGGLIVSDRDAFKRMYGRTVIRFYPDRETIDGVNAAVNCGWEGAFARGCRNIITYPEQEFPSKAWLILIAGRRVPGTGHSEGAALIAHEIVHNLTWGRGHDPHNLRGFSYVRYVGDEFAVKYIDALGIQSGFDAYGGQVARDADNRWRAELTADAITSWAFDDIHGPYAESISDYIRQSMICDLYGGPRC